MSRWEKLVLPEELIDTFVIRKEKSHVMDYRSYFVSTLGTWLLWSKY